MRRPGIAFGFGLVPFGQVVFAMNRPEPHCDPPHTAITHERNQEKTP